MGVCEKRAKQSKVFQSQSQSQFPQIDALNPEVRGPACTPTRRRRPKPAAASWARSAHNRAADACAALGGNSPPAIMMQSPTARDKKKWGGGMGEWGGHKWRVRAKEGAREGAKEGRQRRDRRRSTHSSQPESEVWHVSSQSGDAKEKGRALYSPSWQHRSSKVEKSLCSSCCCGARRGDVRR